MKKLKQKHYEELEIDQSEKDVIMVWQIPKKGIEGESQVIHINREDLPKFIELISEKYVPYNAV